MLTFLKFNIKPILTDVSLQEIQLVLPIIFDDQFMRRHDRKGTTV